MSSNKKRCQINFNVSPEQHQLLEAYAKQAGKTQSLVIKELIESLEQKVEQAS